MTGQFGALYCQVLSRLAEKSGLRKIMLSSGRVLVFFTILVLITVSNGTMYAQNNQRIFKRGLNYFEKGNFVGASDQFRPLLDSGWNVNQVSSYLAQCYFELHEPQKAKVILEQLDDASEENEYLLIIANYFTENFETANSLIKDFQDTANYDVNYFTEKLSSADLKYENSKGFVVQNFGPEINSENREYSAVMYNDFNKLLFTSRKAKGHLTDRDGLDYETIYSTTIDKSNNWIKASPLKIKLEQEKRHDATVQVYKKGTKMISYHDGQLWSSTLEGEEWTKEGAFAIHENEGRDTHCFITEDEQTIYFASDHHSYGAQLDLFVSKKNKKGNWSEPEAMSMFNTEFDEDAPYVAKDGTFYFSSRGHGSLGGYDIYKSKYDSITGKWSDPENLGHPINTVAEDTYYTTDGKLAYLSSTRLDGYGSLDLYRVFLFNKVKIQGTLTGQNNEPIPDVTIDIQYDSIFLRSYTDYNGHYEMFVPINKSMKVTFIKDSLDIYEGDYIVNVFFKDANNNEFNFHIDYSEEGDITTIPESKNTNEIPIIIRNDFRKNPIVDSVSKPRELEWATQKNLESKQRRDRWLLASESEMQIDHTVYFDLNSHELDEMAKRVLDELSEQLKSHKGTVEIVGHTDIRGRGTVNAKLSVRRARSVQEYLKKRGLNVESFLIRGAGSSDLVDEKLSEEAHRRNRRVEINY